MITPDDVPYADPEPLPVLVEECHCVEAECTAHGVDLHPDPHGDTPSHPTPIIIGEAARRIVDGYPDYGS